MKWIGALLLVVLLAGCGQDPDDDTGAAAEPSTAATSASTSPSASPSTSPSASPSSPATTAPITPETSFTATPKPTYMPTIPAEVPPSKEPVDLTGEEWPQFVNGGLDITCLFDDSDGVQVRCDVLEAKWRAKKPADCQGAYGDSVTMRDRAELTCHSDTIFSPDVTVRLGAGRAVKYHDFLCEVGADDVRCENGKGAAFTVSPGGYRLS
jgi:hypothetical protein